MKGSASLTVDPTKLRALIPKAVKYGKDEIGIEDGEAYFDTQTDEEKDVEIYECSKDGIGMTIPTPFGDVGVWLNPDREFLMHIAPLVVDKLNQVMKAVDAIDDVK